MFSTIYSFCHSINNCIADLFNSISYYWKIFKGGFGFAFEREIRKLRANHCIEVLLPARENTIEVVDSCCESDSEFRIFGSSSRQEKFYEIYEYVSSKSLTTSTSLQNQFALCLYPLLQKVEDEIGYTMRSEMVQLLKLAVKMASVKTASIYDYEEENIISLTDTGHIITADVQLDEKKFLNKGVEDPWHWVFTFHQFLLVCLMFYCCYFR